MRVWTAKVAALEAAGHPVIRIEIEDLYEIFGQFFTLGSRYRGGWLGDGHQSFQPA